uniref:Phosphoinositide phospholipase C n=1 Tax=Rhabditophanes sp. KR3021 TaxID=114890 RepID=A0AC35U528_9BILA
MMEDSPELLERRKILERGLEIKRVKGEKVGSNGKIYLNSDNKFVYTPSTKFSLCYRKPKEVDIKDIVEVRQGSLRAQKQEPTKTDKRSKVSKAIVDSACFSVIIMHKKFMCKAVEFMASKESEKNCFCEALQMFVKEKTDQHLKFDEKVWLLSNFQKADINKNGRLSVEECLKLFKSFNLQCSEKYVTSLFKEITEVPNTDGGGKTWINDEEFLRLFDKLTARPDIRHILRQASDTGDEYLTVSQLTKFLKEEQGFEDIDEKKVEMLIDTFQLKSPIPDPKAEKCLDAPGFRRLLISRWGNIMKPIHDTVFQDMSKTLASYYINSSHNTYLTGLQVSGSASIEGYITAMKRGARLLELDVFDGEHGEPIITHKRTLIAPIALRDTLIGIEKYAFVNSPYPVIMTIENHVTLTQQRVMARIFKSVLKDKLYIPPKDSANKELPSPDTLKYKFLLRGKRDDRQHRLSLNTNEDDPNKPKIESNDIDESYEKETMKVAVDPEFGNLISLPSVKLSNNIFHDEKSHPKDGSPSLSETKVDSYYEGGYQLAHYTSTRVVKSYPKGIRQDSSNMDPMTSWLCGIQSVAMNFQTNCDSMDLSHGLFRINGACGYVLKPKFLLDGNDPRVDEVSKDIKTVMHVVIISGQYLPKVEPGNDIVDPYVSIEIHGLLQDKSKQKTRAIKNNGFNPYWNQELVFPLTCPELSIMRIVVKDFDTTSTNDFVGEFTIPVSSIRPGYSHVRLNTGYGHTLDEAATIFVRVVFKPPQN